MIRFCLLITIFLTLNNTVMAQENQDKDIQYFQKDGNKICYHDSGSGNTTIVLVSGLTLGLDTWKDIQEQLSKYSRVISYDRSGLGNSEYVPNNVPSDIPVVLSSSIWMNLS